MSYRHLVISLHGCPRMHCYAKQPVPIIRMPHQPVPVLRTPHRYSTEDVGGWMVHELYFYSDDACTQHVRRRGTRVRASARPRLRPGPRREAPRDASPGAPSRAATPRGPRAPERPMFLLPEAARPAHRQRASPELSPWSQDARSKPFCREPDEESRDFLSLPWLQKVFLARHISSRTTLGRRSKDPTFHYACFIEHRFLERCNSIHVCSFSIVEPSTRQDTRIHDL